MKGVNTSYDSQNKYANLSYRRKGLNICIKNNNGHEMRGFLKFRDSIQQF